MSECALCGCPLAGRHEEHEAEVTALRAALATLAEAAGRVAAKYRGGSDWTEWRDLADALAGARGAGSGAVEGNSKLPANSPRGSGGEGT